MRVAVVLFAALALSACVSARVQVRDAVAGGPVAGARVAVLRDGVEVEHARTGASGVAELSAHDAGTIVLITADGFAPWSGALVRRSRTDLGADALLAPVWLRSFADGGDVRHPATDHAPFPRRCAACQRHAR